MSDTAFTPEELFEKLDQAFEPEEVEDRREPGTVTRPELMKRYGIGRDKATRILNQALEKGILRADTVWRIDDWNTKRPVSGYRFVRKEKSPTQQEPGDSSLTMGDDDDAT